MYLQWLLLTTKADRKIVHYLQMYKVDPVKGGIVFHWLSRLCIGSILDLHKRSVREKLTEYFSDFLRCMCCLLFSGNRFLNFSLLVHYTENFFAKVLRHSLKVWTRLISIVSKPIKIVVVVNVVVVFVQKHLVQKMFGWVQYWAQFCVKYCVQYLVQYWAQNWVQYCVQYWGLNIWFNIGAE